MKPEQPEPKPQAVQYKSRPRAGSMNYTQCYALEAEGWRIGIVTCRRCGAALVVGGDGADNSIEVHDRWHKR